MFNWAYRTSDAEFLHGGPCEIEPSAGRGVVTLSRNPKQRTERYDGAGGIRPATAQEIINYDTAQVTEKSLVDFDNEKLVKALAIWVAGKLGIPLVTAKSEIMTIYRGLP